MFDYCGKCYHTQEVYPFGLCYECWVKYGKPKRMGGRSNPIGEHDDN